MISVYGSTGFIGSNFCALNSSKCISIPKQDNKPQSNNILYFISTVDNYNVYENPYLDVETNLTKLISVLQECKGQKDIVFNFVSSWFVYGKIQTLPATEETYCNPTGFYSITKHAAEKLLISFCETFNMNYRIFRLTNIIGKNDKKTSKKKNALQHMINCLRNNEPIKLYDGGSNIRDYMYVEDCCDAITTCLNKAPLNETINITNNEPKSIGEIINYAKQKLNSTSKIEFIEAPEFHKIVQAKDFYFDTSNLQKLGFTQTISTDKIIKQLCTT